MLLIPRIDLSFRKMLTNVAGADRSEQGIGNGMC